MMRRHPERAAQILEDRRQALQVNMRHTLAAMKAAAEEQPRQRWSAQPVCGAAEHSRFRR
jgi:hypothetical protein